MLANLYKCVYCDMLNVPWVKLLFTYLTFVKIKLTMKTNESPDIISRPDWIWGLSHIVEM